MNNIENNLDDYPKYKENQRYLASVNDKCTKLIFYEKIDIYLSLLVTCELYYFIIIYYIIKIY